LDQATLNTQIPNRTKKEYAQDNKVKINAIKKKYHEKHKSKTSVICDCGGKCTFPHRLRHEASMNTLIVGDIIKWWHFL